MRRKTPHIWGPEQTAAIVNMRDNGLTVAQIALQARTNPASIRTVLRRYKRDGGPQPGPTPKWAKERIYALTEAALMASIPIEEPSHAR